MHQDYTFKTAIEVVERENIFSIESTLQNSPSVDARLKPLR